MLKLLSNFNGVVTCHNFNFLSHLKLYSTSPIESTSTYSFSNYLVDFLGFSNQQALSTSTKILRNPKNQRYKNITDFNSIDNANSVVKFLKLIGLQHSDIQNAVVSHPELLWCKVDKTLIPKSQTFTKLLGFSDSEFAQLINANPYLLTMGNMSCIVPSFLILKKIMGSKQLVLSVILNTQNIRLSLVPKVLESNVTLLQHYGLSIESIRKYLIRNTSPFLRKPDCFEAALIKVEQTLGIPRQSPQFLAGVVLLCASNEKTIESKRLVFKRVGWSDSDIATLVMLSPPLLALSETTISKKLDFLMNELGYEPNFLAKKCSLFTCSLEKRLIPRHKVLVVLREKDLLKRDSSLASVAVLSESQFLNKFVIPFEEVHDVYSQNVGINSVMPSLASYSNAP